MRRRKHFVFICLSNERHDVRNTKSKLLLRKRKSLRTIGPGWGGPLDLEWST